MIDFIKYELINSNIEILEANDYLEFHTKVSNKTGVVGVYMNAYYKGLEFKIYEKTNANPQKRITVEGSLHKYWNNGAHNFNDFGINEINEVLKELKLKFKIDPINCILKQLEIGVNVNPPINTKTLLNNCIKHKTKRFKWVFTQDEGNYIQIQNQRHFIKIYDKMTHYKRRGFDIDTEILRFEIKYSRMRFLNDLGIFSLSDLMSFDLINFTPFLLKEWGNVIFYDDNILKGTKYEHKYSNPTFWENLNANKLKYHRNNLNKILGQGSKNIKNQISNLISDKCKLLNIETSQINPLYIPLKEEVLQLDKDEKNRRFCLITGLNISMQKSNSKLLSHTGLKYYFSHDKKVYNEVKYKYLSEKWINADYKTQIKEIAHNIRNKYNNQLITNSKTYQTQQLEFF